MIERYVEVLPGLSEREVLESLGQEGLVDYILDMGLRVTEIETKMNMASDVLEGAYGTTVDEALDKRARSQRPQLPGQGETKSGEQK